MLEDDIDDDYFTPVPSASLANIFGNRTKTEPANESLKYTPPKKQVSQDKTLQPLETKPNEELKATECLFASTVTAYEWINNDYLSKGKLGFAILKINKTNSYNIVLYNANKTTLSSTSISTDININLKGKNYISFYDSNTKYWSVYGTEEEMNKITEILQNLGVSIINNTSSTDQNLTELNKRGIDLVEGLHDKESDTDSSVNRRTKASILSRMANMGHSVLPSSSSVNKSSESTESNETPNELPKIRTKLTKTGMKRANIDRKSSESEISECTTIIDSIKTAPLAKIEQSLNTTQALNPTLLAMINGQLMPVSNTNAYANSEINLLMTEQRVNNNELRVNINRTVDKVDQVLEKLKFLDRTPVNSNFQIEIMQKLLTEYEEKIKKYEHNVILASHKSSDKQIPDNSERVEYEHHKTEIFELQSILKEKNKEIVDHENCKQQLLKQIDGLKLDLTLKKKELEQLYEELNKYKIANNTSSSNSQTFETKLKEVINDVYHSVSANFESNESYTGDNVMKIIASVLKKTTVQSLSNQI